MTVQDVIENVTATLERVSYYGDVLTRETLVDLLDDLRRIDESDKQRYWIVVDGGGLIFETFRDREAAYQVAGEHGFAVLEAAVMSEVYP